MTDAPDLGTQICFIGFTAARVLHAILYINALQPWRTIMFALGTMSLVAMIVLILRQVFMA